MKMSENIRMLRIEKGMTQEELGRLLGVKKSAIAKYESGLVENIPRSSVKKMADIFGVKPSFILGFDSEESENDEIAEAVMKKRRDHSMGGSSEEGEGRSHAVRIPVYGRVAAGIPIEAITDIEDYEEIPAAMAACGEYAALKINGDSMEPRMTDGDVVIVKIQETIESGEIAVVTINGCDATCKRVKRTEEGIMLISTNPAYEPMYFSNKQIEELPIRIFGKVVELRAKIG